jgi:AraC family transcriptional regulator, regulatory protein of adaptative response / methylated-DNA-[protein]-cysteine methyltransferase
MSMSFDIREIDQVAWMALVAKPILRTGVHASEWGRVLVELVGGELAGLSLAEASEEKAALASFKAAWPGAEWRNDPSATALVLEAAVAAWRGERGSRVRLLLKGTNFQRKVWRELLKIPCGATVSYGEIARRVKRPGGARAVGQAVGANPVAVLVPCHRVLASGGAVGGYAWGVGKKRALLAAEGVVVAK